MWWRLISISNVNTFKLEDKSICRSKLDADSCFILQGTYKHYFIKYTNGLHYILMIKPYNLLILLFKTVINQYTCVVQCARNGRRQAAICCNNFSHAISHNPQPCGLPCPISLWHFYVFKFLNCDFQKSSKVVQKIYIKIFIFKF